MPVYLDLYLYDFKDPDVLYKIGHLQNDEVDKYTSSWIKKSNTHDFMLLTEGSTPWPEEPRIEQASKEFIDELLKDE